MATHAPITGAPTCAPVTPVDAGTLLREVAVALRLSGLSPSTFGRNAANDPRLVTDLRGGRVLRPTTAEKVLAYIRFLAASRGDR